MDYIKQFPDLLCDKTVLYVHGFASSGQSGTVKRMQQAFPSARIIAPDLPVEPEEAIALLADTCQQQQPSLIVGTSMGGMYTEQLAGYWRIVVNPALRIADTMAEHGMMGKQQFFSPRQDGIQEFYVDKPLVKRYRQVTERNFAHADDDGEQKRVFGLFGTDDPLVHTFDLFASHYRQAIRFHGEHRMDDRSFMHSVVPVIRWIDDLQEKRERPIIYIGIEALRDARGNAAPSAQKAVGQLIERYSVSFVAPAPAYDAARYATDNAWLQQYIGVPAWGHTIFTNHREQLYGDYLIETADAATPDTLATRIVLGSEQFKTWDDIIDYYSLMGGQ